MRSLMAWLVVSSLLACTPPGAASDSESITPREITVDRKADKGLAVETKQSWSTVKPRDNGCITPVGMGGDSVPKGILRLDTYTTGRTPQGGLIRETMLERYSPTGTTPDFAVKHDLRTLCAGDDDCTTTELYFECFASTPMADEGMSAIVMLMPWSANDPFFAYYLIRFGPDGQIVFSKRLDGRSYAVAELADGTLVTVDRKPDDTALLVERFDPSGNLLGTTRIEDVQIADSGDGIPGVEHPSIRKILPLKGGGFAVAGTWVTTRDIECYTAAAPKPPTTTRCAQEISHGLVGRFSASGEQLSMRKLGRGFREPDSGFTGAVELENGTVVATGTVAGATALVHAGTSGSIESVMKLCPCGTSPTQWTPGALAPVAVGNEVDFVELGADSESALMLRLTAAGEISTARTFRNAKGKPALVYQQPFAFGGSTFLFEYETDAYFLRMLKLASQ